MGPSTTPRQGARRGLPGPGGRRRILPSSAPVVGSGVPSAIYGPPRTSPDQPGRAPRESPIARDAEPGRSGARRARRRSIAAGRPRRRDGSSACGDVPGRLVTSPAGGHWRHRGRERLPARVPGPLRQPLRGAGSGPGAGLAGSPRDCASSGCSCSSTSARSRDHTIRLDGRVLQLPRGTGSRTTRAGGSRSTSGSTAPSSPSTAPASWRRRGPPTGPAPGPGVHVRARSRPAPATIPWTPPADHPWKRVRTDSKRYAATDNSPGS